MGLQEAPHFGLMASLACYLQRLHGVVAHGCLRGDRQMAGNQGAGNQIARSAAHAACSALIGVRASLMPEWGHMHAECRQIKGRKGYQIAGSVDHEVLYTGSERLDAMSTSTVSCAGAPSVPRLRASGESAGFPLSISAHLQFSNATESDHKATTGRFGHRAVDMSWTHQDADV